MSGSGVAIPARTRTPDHEPPAPRSSRKRRGSVRRLSTPGLECCGRRLVRFQRRLRSVQLKDGDFGSLRCWKANRGQHVFELVASPARTDALLRLPHADDVQGAFADRAVVAQFPCARRAPAAHDQRMRPVVRLPQLVHIAVEAGNEHDSHSLPPNAPRARANCRRLSQALAGARAGFRCIAVRVCCRDGRRSGRIPRFQDAAANLVAGLTSPTPSWKEEAL